MSAPCICPHCGYNLAPEVEVQDGPWSYEARRGLFYDGQPIHLPPSAMMIIGALLRAGGRVLSENALLGVIGSEEAMGNMIHVYITRFRNAIRAAGLPCPVENVWGQGFRWDASTDHTPRNPRNDPTRQITHADCAEMAGGVGTFIHGSNQ